MKRYLEISKNELNRGLNPRKIADFLLLCWKQFEHDVPSHNYAGENIVIMWKSDFDKLVENQK